MLTFEKWRSQYIGFSESSRLLPDLFKQVVELAMDIPADGHGGCILDSIEERKVSVAADVAREERAATFHCVQ
jgi:hypothetical protein